MIELVNISKSYGANEVLKGVNLTLKNGMVHGIIGRNGAGKTTLFKCITDLESYDGKINSPYTKLKDHIGFLPTNPYLFDKITGEEYLRLVCNARDITNIDFKESNIFNLPLSEYATNYSTGMKKKLALTGVLLQANDVYILDEPFNGVDIQSNMVITELIEKLKSLNKIVLISSHIFSTLADVCDNVFLLEEGCIKHQYDKSNFEELKDSFQMDDIKDAIDKLNLK